MSCISLLSEKTQGSLCLPNFRTSSKIAVYFSDEPATAPLFVGCFLLGRFDGSQQINISLPVQIGPHPATMTHNMILIWSFNGIVIPLMHWGYVASQVGMLLCFCGRTLSEEGLLLVTASWLERSLLDLLLLWQMITCLRNCVTFKLWIKGVSNHVIKGESLCRDHSPLMPLLHLLNSSSPFYKLGYANDATLVIFCHFDTCYCTKR